LFVDADGADNIPGTDDDNLRLLPWSPCIDAGDNMLAWDMFVWDVNDLDGRPRIINGTVDMGAYESLVPVESDVFIAPRVIVRNNRQNRVIAILRLPEGIEKKDLSDEPFLLYASSLDTDPIRAIWQRVFGRWNKVTVFALFDKGELMDDLPNSRRIELTVVGQLKSGQHIYGRDTVRITQRQQRLRRQRH
jgi:hypothetical protein